MKRLLSLFDYSGQWAEPFARNGWDAWLWDIKDGNDVQIFDCVETTLDVVEYCDGILAAAPCTDFASSGAQYWPEKDADGRTALSMELVRRTLQLADLFSPTDPDYDGGFFWTIENPVGRLPKLFPELGKAYYFHPYEFAGHLELSDSDHNELDRLRRKDGILTPEERQFVVDCNAYTKKTGLWGDFNSDLKKLPVEPVKCSKHGSPIMALGGSSDKTKELRSNTPEGFANAFYSAQVGYSPECNRADLSAAVQMSLFDVV